MKTSNKWQGCSAPCLAVDLWEHEVGTGKVTAHQKHHQDLGRLSAMKNCSSTWLTLLALVL